MNERTHHDEVMTRLDHLERMLKDIQKKINHPDYNLSITIPSKPVDCVGKCHPDTAIPWE